MALAPSYCPILVYLYYQQLSIQTALAQTQLLRVLGVIVGCPKGNSTIVEIGKEWRGHQNNIRVGGRLWKLTSKKPKKLLCAKPFWPLLPYTKLKKQTQLLYRNPCRYYAGSALRQNLSRLALALLPYLRLVRIHAKRQTKSSDQYNNCINISSPSSVANIYNRTSGIRQGLPLRGYPKCTIRDAR